MQRPDPLAAAAWPRAPGAATLATATAPTAVTQAQLQQAVQQATAQQMQGVCGLTCLCACMCGGSVEGVLTIFALPLGECGLWPVSYTHLRAHET